MKPVTTCGKHVLSSGPVCCCAADQVSPCSNWIKLTSHEWRFMNGILEGENRTASRTEIANALSGPDHGEFDFHRIDMIVLRLRQKIARVTGRTAPIHTLHSHGVTFSVKCHLA